MSEAIDIVTRYRDELRASFLPYGADLADAVDAAVALVPFETIDQYFRDVTPVAQAASLAAYAPTFRAMEAENAALIAKADQIEAQHVENMRQFEEFRRLKTSRTTH